MWTTTVPGPSTVRPGRRALRDAALAAAVLLGTLAVLSHGGLRPRPGADWSPPGSGGLDLAGLLLAAVSAAPVAAWRRSPLGAFTVTGTASVLLAGLGYPLDVALGPAVALYLLTAGRARDAPWTPRLTATVLGLFGAYLAAAAAAQAAVPGTELLHSGLAWAVAWFAGERTRLRRLHVAELEDRARRAEREADRERQLAAAEERARIARELHDTAGHAVNVVALRAGTARLRHHDDPDRSLRALEAIEDLARTTAGEIDQLVGSLRAGGSPAGPADPPAGPVDPPAGPVDPPAGPVDPPAGLASLDTLVARHAAAGLPVIVERSGAQRRLGGAADRAAYRIVQEALTNAARHGSGPARVRLAVGDTAVELTVTNPAPAGGAPARPGAPPRPGGGHGLIGMRERATLLGGDLHAEQLDGTFRVRARIPDRHPQGPQP